MFEPFQGPISAFQVPIVPMRK